MRACLIGLHDSGKSTALAALWFSVIERSGDCEWHLSNVDRPTDAARWNVLRDRWLAGEALKRTEHIPIPESMKLKLTNKDNVQKLTIEVPDITGEDFENLYELGRFPKKHAELLDKSEHLVVFVRVDKYDHPIILKATETIDTTTKNNIERKKWEPKDMGNDSKNVALLRGVKMLRNSAMPKISIVLTAWDTVEGSTTPALILKQRFPLLSQYLETNYGGQYQLIGLSSQGYAYSETNETVSMRLNSVSRIQVIQDNSHHDITCVFA